ncbi:MAG: DUF305 domain-containing protein [Parvularcula sp.]|nr:DUF305 domain-containing protein [Parvularcula sp.]
MHRSFSHRAALAALASAVSLSALASAQEAPIVQPGAPGSKARNLSAEDAVKVASSRYTQADADFMRMMIPHHAQAVEMAVLAADRTNNPDIIDIAGRIQASQDDEIAYMKEWLEMRGEPTEMPMMDHGGMSMADHQKMMDSHYKAMGMATKDEMAQLAEAEGVAFDRMFLNLMIPHHEGALRMVDDLLDAAGSAYDPAFYEFVNGIVADQEAEITKMDLLLANLSEDGRVGLEPGYRDAGEAAMNIKLVASLEKPRGFFDPDNPSNLPPIIEAEEEDEDDAGERDPEEDASDAKTQWGERWPLLSFWNTDMAFSGDMLVAGNYHGFNIYTLDEEGIPSLQSSVVCPGGQGDVSIVGDLLIMSVEQTRGRVDCGLQGVDEDVSEERFRGLRIFDISNPERPEQVGLVQTCRGSHTHSVVSADRRRIVVYNSGTAGVRDEEELEGCIGNVPGDDRTALFSIDVIEIPVRNPSRARITSRPRVFADDETGRIAGLWKGGDHGEGTQQTSRTDQCHDITVFPDAKLAAGACSGNGIILDISDPLKPKRIDAVNDKGFAYWHSATFNNDGTKVLFTDEWGGGTRPRCRASDPETWGADAIYDIEDGKLSFQSYFKIDAPQTEQENCVAHNGSVVPVPGRDIFAQAWYQGGLSVIDFTDSSTPTEIAYFDRGPIHEERMVVGGYWSTYWYDGKIYGTEIIRGLDVLELEPSEHLTENEIAAAKLADMGETFNPQQQFKVTWPDVPVVAMAYLDQIKREGSLDGEMIDMLMSTLEEAEAALEGEEADRALADKMRNAAQTVKAAGSAPRFAALASTMEGIARELR